MSKIYKENMLAVEALGSLGRITIMGVGNSMTPKLNNKQKVIVERITDYGALKKGDIVLVRVGRNIYLHLISKVIKHKKELRFEISNNHKHVNGVVSADNVYGVVVEKL